MPFLNQNRISSIIQKLMINFGSSRFIDKGQINNLKKDNKICKRELQKVLNELACMRQELRCIKKEQENPLQEQKRSRNTKSEALDKKQGAIKQDIEKVEEKIEEGSHSNFQFDWDKKNPYIEEVRIKGKQIVKTGGSRHYMRFSSKQPFPKTGAHKVTFRINKFMANANNSIYFGLTTKQCKFLRWFQDNSQQQSAYYESSPNGYGKCQIGKALVTVEGINSSQMCVLVGEQVQMVVDMNERNISFRRKANNQRPQVNISDLPLPSPFFETSLYPFIEISNYGDTVEVI